MKTTKEMSVGDKLYLVYWDERRLTEVEVISKSRSRIRVTDGEYEWSSTKRAWSTSPEDAWFHYIIGQALDYLRTPKDRLPAGEVIGAMHHGIHQYENVKNRVTEDVYCGVG